MNTRYYRRDGTPYNDVLEWAREFETADRRVAKNVLENGKVVSTVYLGIDHSFSPSGPPLIFETMVFGGEGSSDDLDQERYTTEEEAMAGHKRMVEKYSGQVKP